MAHWSGAYVGIPYADGGRSRAACDCWGLARLIYREQLGIDLPSYGEISAADLARVADAMARGAAVEEDWQAVDEPREWDVAVMRRYGGREPGHVGVMIDARRLLHVEERTAAVIVPRDHYSVRTRIIWFRRHRSMA